VRTRTLPRPSTLGTQADRQATKTPNADRGGTATVCQPPAMPGTRPCNGIPVGPRLNPDGVVARLPLPTLSAGSPQQPGAGHALLPGNGLHLPHRVPFETWLNIGRQLSATVSSSAWCLGDWLIYGETAFTGRYRDAIERTSLDYKTLRNYAWVARRFPLPRRRENLSFGHHAEVAALPEPERDYWLRKAEQLGWSRNQIRHEVRASHMERTIDPFGALDPDAPSPAGNSPADPEDLTILVQVTPDQLSLYQQAASQHGRSIQAWASLALDRAARASVPAPAVAVMPP
jgi:hypothetical protein